MKVVRTICIESEIWAEIQTKGLNASSICNEALKLAVGLEVEDKTPATDAMKGYLLRKEEMNTDIKTIQKLKTEALRTGKTDKLNMALKGFCAKWEVSLDRAARYSEGR